MAPVTTVYDLPESVGEVDELLASLLAEHARRDVSEPGLVHAADQRIAGMAACLAGAGVDLGDAGQRHAFLVGSLYGWRSAAANVRPCCDHARALLRLLAVPFGWTIARLARRA